jgi:hypothetical protein
VIIADKGYVDREFQAIVADRHRALILRPKRQDEPGRGLQLAPIRQGRSISPD